MQCENNHLHLLISFVVMGVALVFLLSVCKLTVATETLSGLAYVLFELIIPINAPFSVFMHNFEFGMRIETCF